MKLQRCNVLLAHQFAGDVEPSERGVKQSETINIKVRVTRHNDGETQDKDKPTWKV